MPHMTEKEVSEKILAPLSKQIAEATKAISEECSKSIDERDTHLIDKFERQLEDLSTKLNTEIEKLAARYSLPGCDEEKGQPKFIDFRKAFKGIRFGTWKGAEFEREVFAEMEKKCGEDATLAWDTKDLDSGTDTAAGFLVPIEQVRPIIEILRSRMVTMRLGAREMSVVGSPVTIPRQDGSTTAYWVGEGSTITPSDLSVGQVSGRPHTCAAYSTVTNQLLQLSSPGVDQLIREDFAAQIARAKDIAAINGVGAAAQPRGVINVTGINSSALTAAPTYNELLGFPHELRVDEALMGRLGWAMHPNQYFAIEKILDASNQPLMRRVISMWSGGAFGGSDGVANGPSNMARGMTELLGYPVETTSGMTSTAGDAGALVFGDWEQLMFLNWGGMQLAASAETGTNFAQDKTSIRALTRTDVIVRHPEAFCVNT